MQTRRERGQEELFVSGPMSGLIPEDHVLKRVGRVLDLSWLHAEVRDCYSQENGRPSIDPESALRLMLAGFLEGVVHDRALMRRAQTDLAFRWFAGYRLDETLPDHSSLTRIRQRWGAQRFKHVFQRTVQDCVKAGLVRGDTVHVDATLIRADVSWESLTRAHAEQVLDANNDQGEDDPDDPPRRPHGRTKRPKAKKRSTTDPEATMATSNRGYHLEPTYKQHTAVDDEHGVVVDVAVQTGEANEGQQLLEQLDRIEANTARTVQTVTADKSYAHGTNYGALESRAIKAIIPPQAVGLRKPGRQRIPAIRFKYDGLNDCVTCPAGKRLKRRGPAKYQNGTYHRARPSDCKACPLRQRCIPPTAKIRSILIVEGYPALLRARRKRLHGWDGATRDLYSRHRWHVEGAHGRAKTQHGLRRAVRRGLDNVAIQVYLTAIVMNLKKLAAHAGPARLLNDLYARWKRLQTVMIIRWPIVA